MSAKCSAVSEAVAVWKPSIVCLQETKISSWDAALVRDIGGTLLDQKTHLPVDGTRGGISIFWNSNLVELSDISTNTFSISAIVKSLADNKIFCLSTIYGPSDDQAKDVFLAEMCVAAPSANIL